MKSIIEIKEKQKIMKDVFEKTISRSIRIHVNAEGWLMGLYFSLENHDIDKIKEEIKKKKNEREEYPYDKFPGNYNGLSGEIDALEWVLK